MKPQARRNGLVVRELPDELLVYDTTQHRAHCLNRTAAVVFRHADGTRTISDLAPLVGGDAGPAEGEAAVQMALERLSEAGLLERAPLEASVSRREVMRRVGIGAAFLLPAVVSIVAPTPAEALVSGCIDVQANPGGCTGQFGPCTCTTGLSCDDNCDGTSCVGGATGGPCT